jgi:hypothetical protein
MTAKAFLKSTALYCAGRLRNYSAPSGKDGRHQKETGRRQRKWTPVRSRESTGDSTFWPLRSLEFAAERLHPDTSPALLASGNRPLHPINPNLVAPSHPGFAIGVNAIELGQPFPESALFVHRQALTEVGARRQLQKGAQDSTARPSHAKPPSRFGRSCREENKNPASLATDGV